MFSEVADSRLQTMDAQPVTHEPPALESFGATDWHAAAQQHHRRVLLAVLALGVRPSRAEEIVQATWEALIEAERSGKLARVELPGIALVHARFLALHELRRGGLEGRILVSSDALAERAADRCVSPEAELLAKEDAQRVLREIERLPDSMQRLFLILYRDPPPSHAECAGELGLSLQRVRQLASELKQRVRATLASETQ
jgi:RNA polymerase sigma factor (sigma-70 family)